MRLGLIGSTGHWQTYAPAIERVRGLTLAAVAAAGPEETTGAFDHAPGLSVDTRRYDDARKMLETERLDVVQVCCRSDLRPGWMRLWACGSQAAYLLTMSNGGVATVTIDYLRPDAAPTHGDERLRIAGSRGVIETALVERKVTLSTADRPPRTLPLKPQTDLFTQFACSLRGEAPPPLMLHEGCRITEIAINAQKAAATGDVVSLRDSRYRTS
jgi:predicted dehydrogenase